MNKIQSIAKRDYLLLKGLEIGLVALGITLLILSINAILNPGIQLMAKIIPATVPVFEIVLAASGATCSTMIWRWYRIPPQIQTNLSTYFTELGYSTKKGLFHTLKVQISDDLHFKIKLQLHKRTSGESCIFKLESMQLPLVQKNPARFKQIAEQFFLNPNSNQQTFTTTCELEEIHLRSLLMTQALEQYLN